ncbi:hypothetical protein AGMMS50284_4300 [Clostridia bacterium]|nr:hypothetical protein AGMMS50284_4300 [Clostridia bacterium]
MPINLNNINAAFAKVAAVTNEIDTTTSKIENIPLDNIKFAAYNPYNASDGDNDNQIVKELADSIEVMGLLEPLVVVKKDDDAYELISGERRCKALKLLNRKTAPCVIFCSLSPEQAALRLHTANLETREYTTSQKFQFYQDITKLLESLKETGELRGGIQKATARMLGVSVQQVAKYKKISSELPEDRKKDITNNKLSINQAYAESKRARQPQKSETGLTFPEKSCTKKEDENNRPLPPLPGQLTIKEVVEPQKSKSETGLTFPEKSHADIEKEITHIYNTLNTFFFDVRKSKNSDSLERMKQAILEVLHEDN